MICFGISLRSQITAQESIEINYSQKVQSLDSTIKTLYTIISGEKDKERDWELFKYLFKPNAEITLDVKNNEGNYEKYYLTVDEYINSSGKWLKKYSVFVTETNRVISTFRHMNHVKSSYESVSNRLTKNDLYSGVNNINLTNENNRWYISNLRCKQELEGKSIPKEYLPVPKD